MQKKGNKYGTHRVIEPKGVLPQPANKIDNNMDEIYDNEILIDVQTLNIDSASFTDISTRAGGDPEKIKEIMFDIVAKQGKHRNPWTGSGGMLLGTVEKIGDALKGKIDLKEGDKIDFGTHQLTVIETPGHTPGGIVLYDAAEHVAFSGDTLFRSSIGRTDLLGGSMFEMMQSLRMICQLPDETKVFPGHGAATTIGEELMHNPYLDR